MDDAAIEAMVETARQLKLLEEDVCYAQLNNRPGEVIETLEARIRFLHAQLAALEAVKSAPA